MSNDEKEERSIQKESLLAFITPASDERGGDILAAKRVEIHADIPAIVALSREPLTKETCSQRRRRR